MQPKKTAAFGFINPKLGQHTRSKNIIKMAKQMRAKVSAKLWKNVNTAVVHYIKEHNDLDFMEEFHVLSTNHRSNMSAFAAFVEDNP